MVFKVGNFVRAKGSPEQWVAGFCKNCTYPVRKIWEDEKVSILTCGCTKVTYNTGESNGG